MTPFLQQLAASFAAHPELDQLSFVFPNLRSALFFKKYLFQNLPKPVWTPRLTDITSFFESLSTLRRADPLTLIHMLHRAYTQAAPTREPFHRFYPWGEMLLRDFDEIDKGLIDAARLFRDLSHWKELDVAFADMPDEQREALGDFWKKVTASPAKGKERFMAVWKKLPEVYAHYTAALRARNMGYEGMIYRDAIEGLALQPHEAERVVFIGFHALTHAEEHLLSAYAQAGAQIYWDTDAYYIDNVRQEAGRFFRRYRQRPALAPTFPPVTPAHFIGDAKSIVVIASPQAVAQPLAVGRQLEAMLRAAEPHETTAIVLPDESLLLPMLYTLPAALPSYSVSVAYPLRKTALYALLDLIMEMQREQKEGHFHHSHVTALLRQAHVAAAEQEQSQRLCAEIVRNNIIHVAPTQFALCGPLAQAIFVPQRAEDGLSYLLRIVELLENSLSEDQLFDRQCAALLYRRFDRLRTLVDDPAPSRWEELCELFRYTAGGENLFFEEDQSSNVHIMGILETRNLDFDNVHILSLNEGIVPSPKHEGSYILHALRKAYQLPTHDQQDAMHSYLFYRLLQRARRVWLHYSADANSRQGAEEMSRYVKQLLYEQPLKIVQHGSDYTAALPPASPLSIEKIAALEQLGVYTMPTKPRRSLSPSALNDYIDCGLRFYLKHVACIAQPDQVEERPDARVLGNLVHYAMAEFYAQLIGKNRGLIHRDDLLQLDERMDMAIESAFARQYPQPATYESPYRGLRLVTRSMVEEWMKAILQRDQRYAPFRILSIEGRFVADVVIDSHTVLLGGTIDRIDQKEDTVRIIDYKTGSDDSTIAGIDQLFVSGKKRNKAAFQTLLYTYIYSRNSVEPNLRVRPELMSRKNLFGKDSSGQYQLRQSGFKKNNALPLHDLEQCIEPFERHLRELLHTLYDPALPFVQTEERSLCEYCFYKEMCGR